jgi:hypothetical protein
MKGDSNVDTALDEVGNGVHRALLHAARRDLRNSHTNKVVGQATKG